MNKSELILPGTESPHDRKGLISSWESRPRAGKEAGEDSWLADDGEGVYALADGMGGYEFGKDASTLVVDTLRSILTERDPASVLPSAERLGECELQRAILSHALGKANVALCKMASERQAPLGSTGTVVRVGEDRLWGAHVGDCRALLFEEQFAVKQLTRDHRPAGLADSNRLERSLGHSLNVACDTFEEELPPRFALLLCCDGVWEHVMEQRLCELVRDTAAEQVAAAVVAAAVANRSDDDVTAVYVESPAMFAFKEELHVRRLEAAVASGSRDAAALDCLWTYHARRQNAEQVSEYLALHVAAVGRPPEPQLLESSLDLLRRQAPRHYAERLRELQRAGLLPPGRLADLAACYRGADDLSPEADQVYAARLRQDERDCPTRAYHALCRLREEGSARAEAELCQALVDADNQLRERFFGPLAGLFGPDGQECRLRLAVRWQHPGVAAELVTRIDEASRRNEEDRAAAWESLLREVDQSYDHGCQDWQQARSKLNSLGQHREAHRLQQELVTKQGGLDQLQRQLEQERSAAEQRARDLSQARQELVRVGNELAQAQSEINRTRQERHSLNQILTDHRNKNRKAADELAGLQAEYESLCEGLSGLLAAARRRGAPGTTVSFLHKILQRRGSRREWHFLIALGLIVFPLALWGAWDLAQRALGPSSPVESGRLAPARQAEQP